MSVFDLIFCFHLKKTAAEDHWMLSSTYGEAFLSERTCRQSLQHFQSDDFDVEALLAEDSCQTQEELAESLEVT